jgi:hypothetical protein
MDLMLMVYSAWTLRIEEEESARASRVDRSPVAQTNQFRRSLFYVGGSILEAGCSQIFPRAAIFQVIGTDLIRTPSAS